MTASLETIPHHPYTVEPGTTPPDELWQWHNPHTLRYPIVTGVRVRPEAAEFSYFDASHTNTANPNFSGNWRKPRLPSFYEQAHIQPYLPENQPDMPTLSPPETDMPFVLMQPQEKEAAPADRSDEEHRALAAAEAFERDQARLATATEALARIVARATAETTYVTTLQQWRERHDSQAKALEAMKADWDKTRLDQAAAHAVDIVAHFKKSLANSPQLEQQVDAAIAAGQQYNSFRYYINPVGGLLYHDRENPEASPLGQEGLSGTASNTTAEYHGIVSALHKAEREARQAAGWPEWGKADVDTIAETGAAEAEPIATGIEAAPIAAEVAAAEVEAAPAAAVPEVLGFDVEPLPADLTTTDPNPTRAITVHRSIPAAPTHHARGFGRWLKSRDWRTLGFRAKKAA